MDKIMTLTSLVRGLYGSKSPRREEWADYLYENHVFQVADIAKQLSKEFNIKDTLSYAGAILHDIADAVMSRFDSRHERVSLEIAHEYLGKSGFSESEIKIITEDILPNHNCRSERFPLSMEAKILATADAIAHLSGGFYEYALKAKLQKGQPSTEICKWAYAKIERDFFAKIQFEDIRELYKEDYERCKLLFSRLCD